jgi:gliding motility-associated-like protein
VAPLINTDYALIVSNGFCSDTDTVSVVIYPTPLVDAGANVTILTSTSTGLNGTGTGTYLWTPSNGLSSTTDANPTANPSATTTYTLVVTDPSGCTGSDSVTVTVLLNIIPNDGLSPNGDGINDVWTIPGIEGFPNALVEVYNRWGELLFSSVGYTKKWDATFKGKDLPVGTYYYVINLNSDLIKDPITGPITILR